MPKKWNPITKWSWLALAIAEYGFIFIPLTTVILTTIIIIQLYQHYVKTQNAKKIIQNIREKKSRDIIKSITALNLKDSTISNITEKYNDITNSEISNEEILKWLLAAEKLKIIKRKYHKIQNQTYVTWKLGSNYL